MPSANTATGRHARLSNFRLVTRTSRADFSAKICFAALVGIGLATLTLGLGCFVAQARGPSGGVLALAGLIFSASCLVQARAIGLLRNRADRVAILGTPRIFGALVVGAFVSYLIALAVGPARGIGYAWLGSVAAWYSALVFLAASPSASETWRKWSQRGGTRRLTWLVYGAMLVLLCAEGSLRAQRFARQHGWLGGEGDVSATESLATSRDAGAPFRVAVIGGHRVFDSSGTGGYLARVREAMPDVEIVPVAISNPWSSHTVDWAGQLAACRADLALAVVDVCQDLAAPPAAIDWFDWRQFALAQCLFVPSAPSANVAQNPAASGGERNYESFLSGVAPQLTVCRTPIDDAMKKRWQRTFEGFEQLATACRTRQVTMAVVLVPGEFQVDRGLCETLARRLGCGLDQFDVELPQRRWTGFADSHDLPTLDLLPHLRLCRLSPYVRRTTAWNDEGHATAASAVEHWLQSRCGKQERLAATLGGKP